MPQQSFILFSLNWIELKTYVATKQSQTIVFCFVLFSANGHLKLCYILVIKYFCVCILMEFGLFLVTEFKLWLVSRKWFILEICFKFIKFLEKSSLIILQLIENSLTGDYKFLAIFLSNKTIIDLRCLEFGISEYIFSRC